jgi:hypothetical protein
MAVTLTPDNQTAAPLASDICQAALLELGVIAQGEPLSQQDGAWALAKLQRAIDQHNARREMIFSISFEEFTLPASQLTPVTIGPNGQFNVPTRPVDVRSATFILNAGSSNPVDAPIKIKDKDWWAANPVKTLLSSITTHLYYDPASPLGNLNFWPICTIANPVRLELWNSIAQAVALGTALSLPQGYWEALVTDLAVKLAPSYNRSVSPELKDAWTRAMRIVQDNNYTPPKIETDLGMPNSRKGGRPDFNFLTGLRE